MTRTSGSASAWSIATASSSRRSGVIVLYSAARVRTIDRTPSAVSVRSVSTRRTLRGAALQEDGCPLAQHAVIRGRQHLAMGVDKLRPTAALPPHGDARRPSPVADARI